MVENALVMPLAILLVFAVFSLAIHSYEDVCAQAAKHGAARETARAEGKNSFGEAAYIRYADFVSQGLERENDADTGQ